MGYSISRRAELPDLDSAQLVPPLGSSLDGWRRMEEGTVISLAEYFGPHEGSPDATEDRRLAARAMLEKVNELLVDAESHGVELEMNPKTGSLVSGQTFGGFRPQDCQQGAPHSSHKEGRAVDVYDPHGDLDRWVSDLILEKHDLYREHPADTNGWCHLSDKAPGSRKRTFHP